MSHNHKGSTLFWFPCQRGANIWQRAMHDGRREAFFSASQTLPHETAMQVVPHMNLYNARAPSRLAIDNGGPLRSSLTVDFGDPVPLQHASPLPRRRPLETDHHDTPPTLRVNVSQPQAHGLRRPHRDHKGHLMEKINTARERNVRASGEFETMSAGRWYRSGRLGISSETHRSGWAPTADTRRGHPSVFPSLN